VVRQRRHSRSFTPSLWPSPPSSYEPNGFVVISRWACDGPREQRYAVACSDLSTAFVVNRPERTHCGISKVALSSKPRRLDLLALMAKRGHEASPPMLGLGAWPMPCFSRHRRVRGQLSLLAEKGRKPRREEKTSGLLRGDFPPGYLADGPTSLDAWVLRASWRTTLGLFQRAFRAR